MTDSKDSEKSDADLFKDAMAGVRPLSYDKQPRHAPKPSPRPRAHDSAKGSQALSADDFADRRVETPDWLQFARPGVQKKKVQSLQRGHLRPEWVLDLHGLQVAQARREMIDFLNAAISQRISVVLVIHGKGRGSEQQPVLKQMLNGWLPQIPEVLAFCSANRQDGGTGAAYVLLKHARE